MIETKTVRMRRLLFESTNGLDSDSATVWKRDFPVLIRMTMIEMIMFNRKSYLLFSRTLHCQKCYINKHDTVHMLVEPAAKLADIIYYGSSVTPM